ncbi:MAG: PSD1 and planctomycete cytochrome C domain-containing protein, partial [Planctomycetota bacterium]|nr:PSD1 and planctomycete cytochrome C domain-containing protein [Planctomycetota bacterium]
MIVGWLSICLLSLCSLHTIADEISFQRDIRPILSDHCLKCHGPDASAREASLRLDIEDSALQGGDSGVAALTPGKPDQSELIRRILSEDESEIMPPPEMKHPLDATQIALLSRWIEAGGNFDEHWSFQPIEQPATPTFDSSEDTRHPVDSFVNARLASSPLTVGRFADRYQLIRRLYFEITGLPPTIDEADAFVGDPRPDAVERLIDRLLASPHYGERMAWNWLDAARYADSNGYQGDGDRTMWPWRDWVVRALNEDLPFDDFTKWQVAGDLLPKPTTEQVLATGFFRNHMINGEGGRIPEENRIDYVMDMTETLGTVWLGLTFNCCRCHDHKYDPLSKRDYYSMFAFFNQTPVNGGGGNPQTPPVIPVLSYEQQDQREELNRQIEQAIARLERWQSKNTETDSKEGDQQEVPFRQRSRGQWEQWLKENVDLGEEVKQWTQTLITQMQTRERLDASVPKVMVLGDQSNKRKTFLLNKGLYNQPEDETTAATPARLPDILANTPETRKGLAEWLFQDDQPLVARVTVNRIWQQIFGTGIVKTVEDFGTQGEWPSHPALLDWLAAEYENQNWSTKALLRSILCSATYQRSSTHSSTALEWDPENRLLSHGSRFRMPSWMIRDQALAVSGLLNQKLGGPSVFPYQPPGVWQDATFGKRTYSLSQGNDLYRRSLYTFWRRIIAPTMFFDTASRQTCSVNMSRTNTPLHALTTLNDTTFVEASRVLAQSIL